MVQVDGRLQNKVLNGFHHFDGDGLNRLQCLPWSPLRAWLARTALRPASGQDGWFFIPVLMG